MATFLHTIFIGGLLASCGGSCSGETRSRGSELLFSDGSGSKTSGVRGGMVSESAVVLQGKGDTT